MSTGLPEKSPQRLYPRKRTATRSTGQKRSGAASTTGHSPSKTTDPLDERDRRRQEIGQILSNAMKNLPNADWARESPEITQAETVLDEALYEFCEGRTSIWEVKEAYKLWAKMHIRQQ